MGSCKNVVSIWRLPLNGYTSDPCIYGSGCNTSPFIIFARFGNSNLANSLLADDRSGRIPCASSPLAYHQLAKQLFLQVPGKIYVGLCNNSLLAQMMVVTVSGIAFAVPRSSNGLCQGSA